MIGRVNDQEDPPLRTESLDAVILALRALRDSEGVSYRAIAREISAQREEMGATPAAAKIAHTTVSDAFRLGRSRINPILVEEIARALGASGESAAQWRARCVAAMSEPIGSRPRTPSLSKSEPHAPTSLGLGEVTRRPSLATISAIVFAGVLLNAVGKFVNPLLGDLFFFDMIGTAAVALLLGPWWSALVGALFMLIELLKGNFGDALFATTMITSGLIWGYGAQRFGLGRTLPRFLVLSALVAIVTSAIAVPITVLYYGGAAGRGVDGLVASATEMGVSLWAVVGGSNLAISLFDKLATGAAAYYLAGREERTGDRFGLGRERERLG